MYHSLIFQPTDGSKSYHTWEDWHLIPSSRPTFAAPELKERVIDIPGADGVIDLTDAFANTPIYQNRQGSFEFIVMNDFGDWQTRYSEIMNLIHGRRVKVFPVDDDPAYFYLGRVVVNEWKSEPINSIITIDYSLDPYKYLRWSSMVPWLWDPFNFENGVIREYYNISVSDLAQSEFLFVGSRRYSPLKFVIHRSSNLTVSVKENRSGATFSSPAKLPNVSSGSAESVFVWEDFVAKDKEYILKFTGTGVISIDYREGSL